MIRAWDNNVFVCETCDNYLLWEHYNADYRMCNACASIVEENDE